MDAVLVAAASRVGRPDRCGDERTTPARSLAFEKAGLMDRTTKVVWPDLAEWVEWAPVLKQFRVNPRAAKPDIQALTRLLRRNDDR